MVDLSTWIRMIGNTTQEECQAIGEDLLELAKSPRDALWRAKFEASVAKYQDPAEERQVAAINAANDRVRALSDGLRADGMGHRQLIAAELVRRGDSRTVEDYCNAVTGNSYPNSDVA